MAGTGVATGTTFENIRIPNTFSVVYMWFIYDTMDALENTPWAHLPRPIIPDRYGITWEGLRASLATAVRTARNGLLRQHIDSTDIPYHISGMNQDEVLNHIDHRDAMQFSNWLNDVVSYVFIICFVLCPLRLCALPLALVCFRKSAQIVM